MNFMISRYSRPEMVHIWSPETKFRIWFEIEAHATTALSRLGVVPEEAAKNIWEKGSEAVFDVERIDAIERDVKHDVIAFLTHLAEIVGEDARFIHQGMTSSDVLDTCLNVQLMRAADILLADLDKVLSALKKRAFAYKMVPTIGRSHGIHAEPVTFGLKMAYAYAEFARNRERLVAARKGLRHVRFRVLSVLLPILTHLLKIMLPKKWACLWNLFPRRLFRATVMPCSLPCLESLPRPWSVWRLKSGICSGQRYWRQRSSFLRNRKDHPPCRINGIRF
jgi:Adenylosuccinate lyase